MDVNDSPTSPLFSLKYKRARNSSGSLKRQAHTFAAMDVDTADKENFNPSRHPKLRGPSFGHHSRSSSSCSSSSSIFKVHTRTSSASASRGLQEALDLFTVSTSDLSTPDVGLNKMKHRFATVNCSTPNLDTKFRFGTLDIEAEAAAEGIDDEMSEGEEDDDEDGDEEADEDGGLPIFGSPLQQRQQTRRRLEMNARIRKNLHRATSLINYSPMRGSLDMKPGAGSNGSNGSNGNSLLEKSGLKTFYVDGCTLPRIDVCQLHSLLEQQKHRTKVCGVFDQMFVVDCRFEYEYRGGHIDGAMNVSSKSELESKFFSTDVINCQPDGFTSHNHKLLVFHCEFSSHRGPLMANNLRKWDRMLNKEHYPSLYYPDIVILEGGYKKFYDTYVSADDDTQSYIEMQDPQYRAECEAGLDKLRRDNKLSLSRHSSCCSSIDSSSCFSNATLSNFSTSANTSASNSSTLLKRWSSTSTASLDFGSTTKLDFGCNSNSNNNNANGHSHGNSNSNNRRSPASPFGEAFGGSFGSSFGNSLGGSFGSGSGSLGGIFGGMGNNKIDLDSLVDESSPSQRKKDKDVFKQPMLPRRHGHGHRRAETVASFGLLGSARAHKHTLSTINLPSPGR